VDDLSLPAKAPPAVRGTAKPNQKDALVYMADVYAGPGLKGVPRSQLASPLKILKRGWFLVVPLIVLVFLMIER